jgi:predicted transcriptional regulator
MAVSMQKYTRTAINVISDILMRDSPQTNLKTVLVPHSNTSSGGFNDMREINPLSS